MSVTAEVEILRGDLAGLLVSATSESSEYRFGDRVISVVQEGDGVLASFEHASDERFDLVVAADGIGSSTRRLILDDQAVVHSLGVEATWATIPRTDTDTDWWRWFNAPGGTISLRPDRHGTTRAIVTRTLSRAEKSIRAGQRTPDQQRALLRKTFAGAGWEAGRVLEALEDVEDLYTEALGQVHAPRWSQGRLVLVGDAAYCPSPMTGMGTTLAIVGAYVLAGEITSAPTLNEGLAAYERVMRPWVEQVQKLPPGVPRIANPTSRVGVAVLQAAIRIAGTRLARGVASHLNGRGMRSRQFELPQYGPLESR